MPVFSLILFKNKLKCKIIIADCGKKYNRDVGFCSNPLAPNLCILPMRVRESAYGGGLFTQRRRAGRSPCSGNTPKRRG